MTGIPQDILDLIQVTRLPALPQVLLKLMAAFRDEDLGYGHLAELIGQDAALAARVVAVANAARYAQGRSAGLEQSLMALGTETTRALVLSAAMQQVFSGFPGADRVDLTGFWRSALGCAAVSRLLAVEAGYANPEEAYLAGLLHDVGRLALVAAVPARYAQSFGVPEDRQGILEAETAAVGCHHAEVGAWLAQRWKLQSFMADAVCFHHEPVHRVAGAHDLVRIVLVGNGLAFEGEAQREPYVSAAQRFFGLGAEQVAALVGNAHAHVAAVAEGLGLNLDPGADPAAAAAAAAAAERSLAEQTRRSALLGALRPALAGSAPELAEALARCIRMLPLPVEEVCIALLDAPRRTLRVHPLAGQDPRLEELAFPAEAEGGVFARVLHGGEAVDSFTAERVGQLALEDRQLLELLGVPGLLAIPLAAGGRVVGALGLGVGGTGLSALRDELPLLAALGAVAAAGLAGSPQPGAAPAVAPDRERAVALRSAVHEASNRLGIIRNSLKILSMRAEAESPIRPELESLDADVQRVGSILQRLADGAGQGPGGRALDLNRLVQEEVLVYSAALVKPGGVRLRMDLDPRLPLVVADDGLLRQALLNLVKNAVEAMPGGGEVTVSTRAGVNQGGAPFVSLAVSDNGPGLPEPVLERLFQPVESGKGGDHAGLGLSVTGGIVKSLDGVITCRTAPGRGTVMEILLPRAPSAAGATRPPRT